VGTREYRLKDDCTLNWAYMLNASAGRIMIM